MAEQEWLAERFDEHRDHLAAVAYRMLGSRADADDALQEAWLRFARSDSSQVENLGGWLTTIVSRVCLNALKSRTARNEAPMMAYDTEATGSDPDADGPEFEAVHCDSVGVAMLVVLETLTPAERLAFVLHDIFAMPFGDIAPIVERTPAASRQLASRARRRVPGGGVGCGGRRDRHREVVGAFQNAA
ncbi:MAG: sigma-70 family RNA polymerase sigma factor, partial [Actinomycetia bacterium]|nr:sigma-70 family RNA polymerase sigma factor [Actinomycetes bacterium]